MGNMAMTRAETAACYMIVIISAVIGMLADTWFLMLKPISADTDNVLMTSKNGKVITLMFFSENESNDV